MSILKAPPKQPKNATLQLRVDEELKIKLDKYAEFLDSTESYVVDGHFDKPKTKRGMRTIPIGAETVEILTVLRPVAVDARALVFAKSDETPLDRWNLLRKHLNLPRRS